jgi:superfamily II DNA or RNA helicase
MADIIVEKKNESTLHVKCATTEIYKSLSDFFSAFATNYQFHPKFRAKPRQWDGKIRFFMNADLPIGLLGELKKFAQSGKYTYAVRFDTSTQVVTKRDFYDFVLGLNITNEKGEKLALRDYQLKAAYEALNEKILNISSSTSSGKSVIIYMIVRWLIKEGIKVLCVVPSTMLVEQLFSDFATYGWDDVEDNCCMIYAGKKRMLERSVVISTWQSLADEKNIPLLEMFQGIIIDECHGVSENAKVLSSISKNSKNAFYRIGLSGSYPTIGSADWLTVVGTTGQIKVYSTYKTLQDAGHITKHKIIVVKLKYPLANCEFNFRTNIQSPESTSTTEAYNSEMKYIYAQESRTEFIAKLLEKVEGNSLVLFGKKGTHGIPMFERLKELLPNHTLLYIDGDVSNEQREVYKKMMEANDKCVLCATYQTLGVGVSIKRIHNLILASGTKSRVKIIQALGRGMRLFEDKDLLRVYDLVDDLCLESEYYTNYSYKHFLEREAIYNTNGFDVMQTTYNIKE